jgi:hypothetical protein
LVLAKVHFLATKTRNQRSKVSGVTSVANLSRRRRPRSLALRASRIRWASVKRLGLPPSCSSRMRFSSWSLLVSAHPAGDRDEQELELRRHRVENLSKVLVAQYSIWSRLSFLAVQVPSKRTPGSGLLKTNTIEPLRSAAQWVEDLD